MATDLGKIGMVMKGNYNSASTYEALDVVSYQNGLYVAKQSVPAGTVPTNTTYWQVAINEGTLSPKIVELTSEGVTIESLTTGSLAQITNFTSKFSNIPTGYTMIGWKFYTASNGGYNYQIMCDYCDAEDYMTVRTGYSWSSPGITLTFKGYFAKLS